MLMKYKLTVFSSRNTRLYIALFLHITDFPLNVYNCYKFMPPTVFFFWFTIKIRGGQSTHTNSPKNFIFWLSSCLKTVGGEVLSIAFQTICAFVDNLQIVFLAGYWSPRSEHENKTYFDRENKTFLVSPIFK